MKRLGVFLLCLMLLFTSGCIREEETEENEKTVQIGMIFDTFVIERWQKDRDIFVSTIQELGGEVDIQNANGDVQNQIEQMEYFIREKVDVIVVVPIEAGVLVPYVEKARKEGIRVISYDRIIADAGTDLYISFDNEAVGKLMAETLGEVVSTEDKVLMINGPKSDLNVFSVSEGFQKEMEDRGIEILDVCYVNGWKAEEAGEYVEENLDKVRKVQAIMCGNDALASQVIQKLAEFQLSEDVYVVGQDADLDACQRIVEGSQYMTVYKSIDDLAKTAANAAVKMAKGEEIETQYTINDGKYEVPFLKLKPVAVTKDNMDEVIIDSGFHLKEEVYLNCPELIN